MIPGLCSRAGRSVVVLTAGFLLAVHPAEAALQTVTTSWSSLPVGTPTSSGTHPLVVTQFDPGLGTLVSVELRLTLNNYLYHQYENTGAGASSTLTVSGHAQTVTLEDPFGGPALVSRVHAVSDSHVVGARDYVLDYAGTGGVTAEHVQTTTDTVTVSSGLGGYTGLGTVVFDLNALSDLYSYSFTGGNGSVRLSTELAADLSVGYTFTPIPELSTIGTGGILLGLGLLVTGFRRRDGAAIA